MENLKTIIASVAMLLLLSNSGMAQICNLNLQLETKMICADTDSGGRITAHVSGGTGSYEYRWAIVSTPWTADSSIGVSAGTYGVTAADVHTGCSVTDMAYVAAYILVIDLHSTDVNCDSTSDGSVFATVYGEPPYTYNWTGDNNFSSNDSAIVGVPQGAYSLLVTDINGCSSSATAYIDSCEGLVSGLNDINRNVIPVYPNPFTDKLTITPNVSYQLFDLVGREVDKNNLSALPVGTYVLKSELGITRIAKIEK